MTKATSRWRTARGGLSNADQGAADRDASGRRPSLGGLALFAAAYVLACGLGQWMAVTPGIAITFWPPVGIFVATLLLNPRRTWPYWITFACLAELIGNAIWFDNAIPLALVYFSANGLTALLAAWLVGRFAPWPLRLESLEEVAVLTLLAASVAPMASATIIAATDAIIGKHTLTTAWMLVWIGDSSGLLVAAPLTFAVVQAWRRREQISRAQVLEVTAVGVLLLVTGFLAFRNILPTIYLVMPLVLWTAARFQLKGVAVTLPLVAVMTAAFALTGSGELANEPAAMQARIVSLQLFLGICAVSALLVAAISAQRQQAIETLNTINAELERRVDARTTELAQSNAEVRDRQAWLAGQREALEAAVHGAPLQSSLGVLVRTAMEAVGQGARAAFFLANEEGAAAPCHVVGMPADDGEPADDLCRGLASMACDLANATGQPVLAADVREDARWQPWLGVAEALDFRACWCFPIRSPEGTLYGALALLSRRPREATQRDQELCSLLTQTASIIISRNRETATRQKAEALLRESEAQFRAFASATSDVVFRASADWREMRRLQGLEFVAEPPEPGRSWQERHVYPDDRPLVAEAIRNAMVSRSALAIEHRVIREDGSLCWISSRAIPILSDEGDIVEWLGTASDITQRKQAEVVLAASHATLRQLVENSPFGVYVVDADFRLLMVSAGALKVFENVRPLGGRDFEEVLRVIWPEPFASEAIQRFRHTLATGEPYHAPSTIEQRADIGRTEAYDWKLERLILPDGRPGVVCHFYDLSERLRYEETLRIARNRLETALDASHVVLFHQDRDLRYTWVHNPGLGFAAQEVVGRCDGDLMQRAEDAERLESIKRSVINTGIGQREEVCIVRNGASRYFDLVVQPDRDVHGEIIGVNCAAVDVTERKEAEVALRRSESIFRRLAESDLIGVGIGDTRGAVTYINDELLRMMGYSRADFEAGAVNWSECIAPEFQGEHARRAEELLRDGKVRGYQRAFLRPDGGRTPFLGAAALVEPGHDLHVSIALDLTAIRAAESALRASEHRYRTLVDATSAVTWSCSAQGLQVEPQPSWMAFTGQTADETLGTGWTSAIHPDDAAPVMACWEEAVARGTLFNRDLRIRRHDGEWRWMNVTAAPVRDASGDVIEWFGMCLDISDRKQHEKQMRTVMAELNHRVKNTLAVVSAIARQTMRRAPDLETFSATFGSRLQSIAKAHSLLTRTDWEGCSLEDIVRSEVGSRLSAPRQASMVGPSVMLSPKQCLAMYMVIHELSTNAMKYGALKEESGRIEVRWEVEHRSDAPWLRFRWIEHCAREIAAPGPTGFGSRLIEQSVGYELEGDVERQFTPRGLQCSIRFPLGNEQHRQKVDSVRHLSARDASAQRPRVLVVEDNVTIAMSLADDLAEMGVDVLGPANSLNKAIGLIEVETPTAALLDVDLNGTRVYPLARMLRQRGVRFMLLTGYELRDLPDDLQEARVINKPINRRQIEELLSSEPESI